MKKIEDLMTRNVISIKSSISFTKVLELFTKYKISHLIVSDALGVYKGVISNKDLVNRLSKIVTATSSQAYTKMVMENLKAADVMTANTVNLEPGQSIDFGTELLLQGKFHSLPVIKNKRIVGLITKHDLLKGYYEQSAYNKNMNHE